MKYSHYYLLLLKMSEIQRCW